MAAPAVAAPSEPSEDLIERASLSASAPPGLREVFVCDWVRLPWFQMVVWSARAWTETLCSWGGVFVPERNSPSAMLHSKVAMLSSPQAARTRLTACTSSDVSITTMGVDEL